MNVPLFRVHMNPNAKTALADLLTPSADGGLFIGEGPRVREFELALQQAFDAPVAPLATNSCTSALTLAYRLCGVGPGTAVIATPQTCTATIHPIALAGAEILWADVDPVTGNIDPASVSRLQLRRGIPPVRAIVACDWGGRPAYYSILRYAGIPIIEDAAHAPFATIDGKSIARGGGGDYVCWSFGPIKHFNSIHGGALLSHRGDMDRARLLRWYGLDRTARESFRCEQIIDEAGYLAHMTDAEAVIGLANLPDAPRIVARHRANARWYQQALSGTPGVELPPFDEGSSYWLYTILVERRDEFIQYAASRGVETSPVHAPCNRHPAFPSVVTEDGLPGLAAFSSRQVAIPVHWALTEVERAHVAEVVRDWARLQTPRLVLAGWQDEAVEQLA